MWTSLFSRPWTLKIYQVEGTIWVWVRILSSKWTRISVKNEQSTVLSRKLLARGYEKYQYFKNSNTQNDIEDRLHDNLCMWVVSGSWRHFRRSPTQLADQWAARNFIRKKFIYFHHVFSYLYSVCILYLVYSVHFLPGLQSAFCTDRMKNINFDGRFQKHDMQRLLTALEIPECYICVQRTRATGTEALMILLRRLAYPARWCDLVPFFGRSESELSLIFNTVIFS